MPIRTFGIWHEPHTVSQLMFETKEDCNVHKCRFDCNMAGVEKWGKSHCDVCNLDFAGRDLLLNHNLTYHVTEKKFACDLCDFKVIFFKNYYLFIRCQQSILQILHFFQKNVFAYFLKAWNWCFLVKEAVILAFFCRFWTQSKNSTFKKNKNCKINCELVS